MDATFVTTTTENGTEFLSPRPTYVISKDGKTTRDATFHVAKEPANKPATKPSKSNKNKETAGPSKQKSKISAASSIMTEDDSDSGSPVQPTFNNFKQPLPLKTGKELFR